MGFMLAAWPDGHFEFFAQAHQKTFAAATRATCQPDTDGTKRAPTKKPALIAQVRAVKSKENLKRLKN
jgi:hypothetical protein